MAEDTCVSVSFESDGAMWDYCWEDGHPSAAWHSENVTTGLRPNYREGQGRSWRACQYYLSGMAPICAHWVEGALSDDEDTTTSGSYYCSYVSANTSDDPLDPKPEIPSGFNSTDCDFLGRRQWCSKYEASGDVSNEIEWICTAPNPYVTGLGRKHYGDQGTAIFTNVERKDIWGYNNLEDGTGTGVCDCYGMGRGKAGCSRVGEDIAQTEKNLAELPVKCNFYRPYQMGFGIVEPDGKDKGDVEDDQVTITEQGWKRVQEWDAAESYRLPLNYELYNNRALFQKCQWWEEDASRKYGIGEEKNKNDEDVLLITLAGGDSIFDATGRVEFCKCTDTNSIGYNTRIFETDEELQKDGARLPLDKVHAQSGGPVCNGCRPECPCYSGKWSYLTGERMFSGMPVTANQILELRFYAQEWDSQDAYDKYYSRKPNFEDPNTASIYTFTKWQNPSNDVEQFMEGKELSLCQPAPLNNKVFTRDYVDVNAPVNYFRKSIGTSNEDTQRQYPSLVRDPEVNYIKPFVVTYPYYNDDVFDPEICKQPAAAGYSKLHNNIYGDSVRSVGQTIRSKQVYLINISKIIPINPSLLTYNGIYAIKDEKGEPTAESKKGDIYNTLRELIHRGYAEDPEYISSSSSDSTFGYFLLEPVKIKYGQSNSMLIAVDYGDGTWEYRVRKVHSRWFGGMIKQSLFSSTYGQDEDGYTNSAPQSFSSDALAEGRVIPLGYAGVTSSGTEVLSTFSVENIKTAIRYYSWSMVEITKVDSFESHWGAVGNSNKIFVEIGDTNVNYVYNWEIESAKLNIKTETDENGDEVPVRSDVPEEIELQSLIENDDNLPPSVCVLEPVDSTGVRFRFLPTEWDLYITFKYEKLVEGDDTENGEVVAGAGLSNLDVYSAGPHDVSATDTTIYVNGITNGSVQLMAHFIAADGRITSSFATKFITKVITEGCRNVDIYYIYEATGRKWALQPEKGFCIDIKQDKATGEEYKHVEVPDCGDHENDPRILEGPMWYPYNSCRGYDLYDIFTVCNNCQAGYVGPQNDGVAKDDDGQPIYVGGGTVLKRNDYRYCGPYKYEAFGDTRGNWAASCDCGCSFYYSDASSVSVVFSGLIRKRTTVDLGRYAEYGWRKPPFGNEGRETVEKFLSIDYLNHIVPDGNVVSRSEWLPLAMDHSIFFSTFNAYDDNPEDEYFGINEYYSFEPFRYTHQLNMGVLINIEETIDETNRYRWDDLFEVHHEGNCSYPLPAYPVGSATKALFYYLKPEWASWAWQEGWKDIERNVSYSNAITSKLDFVKLERIKYVFDGYKSEHRLIADEGDYALDYVAPKLDNEGNIETYPTVSIGANVRGFEIIYDEDKYDSTPIDWKDEGASVQVDGASVADNLYEKTVKEGSEWYNDRNILYDNYAEATTENANKFIYSIDFLSGDITYKYYNRGVIANLTREDLYYLPKEEIIYSYSSSGVNGMFAGGDDEISTVSTSEYDYKTETLIPGSFVWDTEEAVIESQSSTVKGWSWQRLHINGNWGYSEGLNIANRPTTHLLYKAGVSISYDFSDGSSGPPKSLSVVATEVVEPVEGQGVETYDIYLEFLLGPVEMITKKVIGFSISLSGAQDGFISINNIELTKADYKEKQTEGIKIWERKYVVSNFKDVSGYGINLDGPGDHLHYQEDIYNGGQYFPFRSSRWDTEELAAIDKMRVISCGIRHSEDESVDDPSYDNLHYIEKEEQRILYEYAYFLDEDSDMNVYGAIIPVKYRYFMDTYTLQYPLIDLIIESEKLAWEKHSLVKQFKQYEFWRPGGHYYTWNDHFRTEKCMLFDPGPRDVFSGKFVHLDHQGVGNPVTDGTTPVDPGNSYYSLRFYTQQAKYDRAMIIAGGEPESGDRWTLGGSFITTGPDN